MRAVRSGAHVRTSGKPDAAPAFLQLPHSHCDAPPRSWQRLCKQLQLAHQYNASVTHIAHQPVGRSESSLALKTLNWNAGDAVLPVAVRMAVDYFLGRFRWRMGALQAESTDTMLADWNADNNLAVIVGGGGLFTFDNAPSWQSISGWHWKVHSQHLLALRVPVILLGVGWNGFPKTREQEAQSRFRLAHNPKSRANRDAFAVSMAALVAAHKSTLLGLRDSYSINAARGFGSGDNDAAFSQSLRMAHGSPEGRQTIVYQPCSTTLVGAIQPSLASRALLASGAGLVTSRGRMAAASHARSDWRCDIAPHRRAKASCAALLPVGNASSAMNKK